MLSAIWKAVDHRNKWERVFYKGVIIASVLLIIPGVPISVFSADYTEDKDMFMMSEADPDFNANPAIGFEARRQQNELAHRENKQTFYTALLTPFGVVAGLWGFLTAIFSVADRTRMGRPE
jgi:hypothetical protein